MRFCDGAKRLAVIPGKNLFIRPSASPSRKRFNYNVSPKTNHLTFFVLLTCASVRYGNSANSPTRAEFDADANNAAQFVSKILALHSKTSPHNCRFGEE